MHSLPGNHNTEQSGTTRNQPHLLRSAVCEQIGPAVNPHAVYSCCYCLDAPVKESSVQQEHFSGHSSLAWTLCFISSAIILHTRDSPPSPEKRSLCTKCRSWCVSALRLLVLTLLWLQNNIQIFSKIAGLKNKPTNTDQLFVPKS